MSAHEVCRPEGGPLERTHMKDMVQRNTLESVALTKIAKHLETERKAFVRQSTRDEEEMKTLLQRLQFKQQEHQQNSDSETDEDALGDDEIDGEIPVVNPYPITIVPKYGAFGNSAKSVSSQSKSGSQSRYARRRSDEYDDVHDSTSLMTSSSASISDQHPYLDDVNAEWLASPNAISSVRRLRKTIPEQIQRKILIRSGSEISSGSDPSSLPSSPLSRSRSNSLKERKKSVAAPETDVPGTPRGVSRRGGSLKERKHSHVIEDSDQKKLIRSYSMMTKGSLRDDHLKVDAQHFKRKLSDHKHVYDESGSDVRHSLAVEGNSQCDQNRPIIRKNSKKIEKSPLAKKLST